MVEKKGFYFKVKIDNMEKESQFTSGEMGNFSVTVTWKVWNLKFYRLEMRIKKPELDTEVFSERTVTGDLALRGETSPHLLIFSKVLEFL